MRKLTVYGLVASAVVAVAASSGRAASIIWGTCQDSDLQDAGAQCGMLTVPLDYASRTAPRSRSRCRGSGTRCPTRRPRA